MEPVSFLCFYCSNPVNAGLQTHVIARIEHHYKSGGSRESVRAFHSTCFEKFENYGGRPYNPDTQYYAMDVEEIQPSPLTTVLMQTEDVSSPPTTVLMQIEEVRPS